MFEELLAYALLLDVGIVSASKYGEYLDALFTKMPDNDLILELEWNFSDAQTSISMIRSHCNECCIDYNILGKFLFSELAEIYFQNRMDIQIFGEKSCALWRMLPDEIHQTEPFWTLIYADDPLSWGDEKLTRELYEKAFRFYISA